MSGCKGSTSNAFLDGTRQRHAQGCIREPVKLHSRLVWTCGVGGWHDAHALGVRLPLCLQEERQEQDADFKPNLINTVCFLVNFIIQASHSPSLLRAPGFD